MFVFIYFFVIIFGVICLLSIVEINIFFVILLITFLVYVVMHRVEAGDNAMKRNIL